MAATTSFLLACQTLFGRINPSGSGIATVIDQPQEYSKVIQAIVQAHMEIVNAHPDWKFLWATGTLQVGVGSNPGVLSVTDVGTFNTDSFYLADGTHMCVVDHDDYTRYELTPDEIASTSEPESFTILPDNTILMLPYPDGNYTLRFQYWKACRTLAIDTDILQVPDDCIEAVYARAHMIWMGTEEAPGYQIKQTDFEMAFLHLEQKYWPGALINAMARNQRLVMRAY